MQGAGMTRDLIIGPGYRQRALAQMRSERFDLVVVGGGVTGCGIALDAATRGLSVALVEMRDYAAGTSSRSGKLIHGGLRYMEHLQFGLVRESLTERALLLQRLCPHLVKPMRFMYLLEHRGWGSGTPRRRPGPLRHAGRRRRGAAPPPPHAALRRVRAGAAPTR